MSVFTLRRLAGTSSSSPDFCPLRFRGVSSYVELIPELASSHMVSITFFSRRPRRFWGRPLGSWSAQTWTWASAGERGNEGGRRQTRKTGLLQSSLLTSSHLLSCLISSFLFESRLLSSFSLSCFFIASLRLYGLILSPVFPLIVSLFTSSHCLLSPCPPFA